MEEMTRSLRQRTITAFGWRFISVFCKFCLQLALGIILSRILPVNAFGLLGMAMVIIGVAAIVSEIGIGPALVQRVELTEKHIHVGFTVSVLFGFLITLVVWLVAPSVGTLFGSKTVTSVVQILSLTLLINSIGTTASGLLQRKLDFRKLLVADIASYTIGYAFVGILLAMSGYGVWSLVWAAILQSLCRTCLLMLLSQHRLCMRIALIELRQLLHFGTGISLARIANYAARNIDYFVVGRWLGAVELGLYSRAYQLMTVPISEFSSVITFVLFPAYARIQKDHSRLKRVYLESISLAAIVVFPLLAFLTVIAPELIRGLFGPKWVGATRAFQILCVGGFFRSMYNCGDALARAMGAVYAQFRRHFLYAIFVLIGAIAGSRYGIEGVAVGVSCALLLMYLMTANLSLQLLHVPWWEYAKAQLPAVFLSFVSVVTATLMAAIMRYHALPDLVILFGVGLMVSLVLGVIIIIFPTFRASVLLRDVFRDTTRFLK